MDALDKTGPIGKVMVVDDNLTIRLTMELALADRFEVLPVPSGEVCLAALEGFAPDLILLDIEMEGMNGHETCRRLRADGRTMPVIFVSSHDGLDERLKAFDSGGDDFIIKPFDAEVLLRKAESIVRLHGERERLKREMNTTREMAFGFLKSAGETGVLLEFLQQSMSCADYGDLARRLAHAVGRLDVAGHVQVRYPEGSLSVTPSGPATPLEASILERSATLGRLFQFRSRLVVNYPAITVLVVNLPDDPDFVGRLRDNLAVLAESADIIAGTIGMRRQAVARAQSIEAAAKESVSAVETLRALYRRQQSETRIQLESLIGAVEGTYVFLGLTDSQEATLSEALRRGSEEVLQLFQLNEEFDHQFGRILKLLRP